MKKLGIIVNPMSGRDVRRVTAKASTSAHHDKQQHVTRLILGALEHGVDRVYLGNEPFRISERAAESTGAQDKIEILNFPLSHTDKDTTHLTNAMWEAGCRVFIVLGGDGTNRIVAKAKPDAIILPLSTGTNNVFPLLMEASVAGAAAGLIASEKLNYQEHCQRCKIVQIKVNGEARDIALIDAVLLQNDHLGSLLPFSSEKLQRIYLTRAEPASVGMSPIGGYLMPANAADDFGVMVSCQGEKTISTLRVPLSPGLYGDVPVTDVQKMALGENYLCPTPGILAFDGDRTIELAESDHVEISIGRTGPWIIEPEQVMTVAAQHRLLMHSP